MELHNMQPTPGARHKKKRVGRGDKTAGRGENGQKSRAGYSKKIGFEGGQNPLYKRIPKRGFTNINKKEWNTFNASELNDFKVSKITPELLVEKGLVRSNYKLIKVLGNGELTAKVEISAHKFSKTAKKQIEDLGGKAIIITK